jgi:hypothetical protein
LVVEFYVEVSVRQSAQEDKSCTFGRDPICDRLGRVTVSDYAPQYIPESPRWIWILFIVPLLVYFGLNAETILAYFK